MHINKTVKIAISCFIGGIVGSATALTFSSSYWWLLGLVTGFSSGYLSYEFKKVSGLFPHALFWIGEIKFALKCITLDLLRWFSEPHPFWYTSALISIPVLIQARAYFFEVFQEKLTNSPPPVLVMMLVYVVLSVLVLILVSLGVSLLSFIGEDYTKSFLDHKYLNERQRCEKESLGYKGKPLTYTNLAISMSFGIWCVIKVALWHLPGLLINIILLVFECLWDLFKFIHSHERLLCGIDGALGGLISYLWLSNPMTPGIGKFVIVVCGGLIGAALGVFNYRIVSKRWLNPPSAKPVSVDVQ